MDTNTNDLPTQQLIPLGSLPVGACATVVRIDGQPDVVLRLHEMGVRPGCPVRMIQPGAACVVAIGNHRFGFRGAESALILVEVSSRVAVAS
jgi:ferrous iron transport protein A